MSATDALNKAWAVGVRVKTDGDDLVLAAPEPPPQSLLNLLSRHKVEVVRLLRRSGAIWLAEDWRAFFDERASLAEFDGGLSRAQAEERAFTCCVSEWLTRNPVHSSPQRCLGCGGRQWSADPLLPFGAESFGQAWLHSRCWSDWHDARKAEAAEALRALGLTWPLSFDRHS